MSPDNRLKAWKDLRLIYDAWGNVSERHSSNGYQRFTYDCENRLVRAETYRGHDSLSQASYEYDCLGRRIAKHVQTEDKSETTRFLWQGLRMLQEQKADLHSLYIYETGSYAPLARLDTDPSQPDQKPKRYYFHTDQIGTPLEVTDDTGGMVWRAYYKTWGALEALVPREIEQNLRFQGQYHDAETGLHYNTFRYYDPVVGRFTTQDPIGLLGGKNLYQYTSNPVIWIDPLGWMPWSWNPNGMGHHLVPRGKANSIGLTELGFERHTPTYFPIPYKDGMHELMHRVIKDDLGKLLGPWNGSAAELFEATSKRLDEVSHIKGELRIPATGEVIASNVTPKQAHKKLIEWYNKKITGGC